MKFSHVSGYVFMFIIIPVTVIFIFIFFNYLNDEVPYKLLNSNETEALEQFQSLVGDSMYMEYEAKGLKIIHFLRAKNLNVEEANKMIQATIEWRNLNHIDNILNETLLQDINMYHFAGVNRNGGPVVYISSTRWDVRKLVNTGKYTEFLRYLIQLFENGHLRTLKTQNSTRNGSIQYTAIINFRGYNLKQHACIRCFSLYSEITNSYENYYPQDVSEMIFLNVPKIAQTFFELLKPIMAPQTREVLQVFASDKQEWTSHLRKIIEPSQLLVEYGGTMILNNTVKTELGHTNNTI